jgi:hypothetical protein
MDLKGIMNSKERAMENFPANLEIKDTPPHAKE